MTHCRASRGWLGKYLIEHLNNAGYATTKLGLDDLAWTFVCYLDGQRFWIHLNESGDALPQSWVLIINSTLNPLRRLFGQSDLAELEKLCRIFQTILINDGRIGKIVCYTEDEWTTGIGGEPVKRDAI